MIVNMCYGTNDLVRAARFYDALAEVLEIGRVMETDRAIFWGNPNSGINLAITLPFDGKQATAGNGTMATIAARDSAQVDRLHAAALANGGSDEGAPGVRPHGMYAAYFRDPDGNKLNCFARP